MPTRNFVSPHVHIASLDSASTPKAFAQRELELETGAITVTEHGTLQATRQVYDLVKDKKSPYYGKLIPILGVEGYFRDDNCPILAAAGIPKNEKGTYVDFLKYFHLTLHCLDEEAYGTLCRVLSDADAHAEQHGSERKPLFNWKDLEELGSKNITVGSGCLIGMVQRFIMAYGRFDLAEAYYRRLRATFKPNNFFVEVFPHVCDRNWDDAVFVKFEDGSTERFPVWKSLRTDKKPPGKKESWKARELADSWRRSQEGHGALKSVMQDRKWVEIETPKRIIGIERRESYIVNDCQPWAPGGDLQYGCNKAVIELAKKYGDKILISDDSHFVHEDEKVIQDVRLQQSGSWRFSGAHFRYSSADAWKYFKDVLGVPEAEFESWVDNNTEWSQRFKDFKFTSKPVLPVKFYPTDTLRHTFSLINRHGRMKDDPIYRERLLSEIKLLHQNGTIDFLPYFFTDEEVCSLYERKGELTGPGRGSAAGLLLAYLEGITHVDPIRYGLSKDRFMTDDRIKSGAYPDIDQDLGERDTILVPWLEKRFPGHFAQISTDTTLKLRSSVKDVARWKRAKEGHAGFVPPEMEDLVKKFEEAPQGVEDFDFVFGYKGAEDMVQGSIERDPALQRYIRDYPDEWDIVRKCLGLSRQKGRHASGYVITNSPIKEFIPLTSVGGVKVTQFTAHSVEAAGAIKMDFLIVKVLRDIGNCIRMIQSRSPDQTLPWQSAYTLPDDPGVVVPSIRIGGLRVPLLNVVPSNGNYHDIWDLPEDQAVFRDFCNGDTETVFQFSTPGAVKWLRQFNFKKPDGSLVLDSITALAVFNALNRPGGLNAMVTKSGHKKIEMVQQPTHQVSGIPEEGTGADGKVWSPPAVPKPTQICASDRQEDRHNMLVEYSQRARGLGKSPDILPVFDELLPETYGVMVFQEQLQQMYQHLTGCTGPQAEEFRRNVAKKKMDAILKVYPSFIEGAGAKIGPEAAKAVWEFFVTWAEYGFNKSHAVSYSIIGYACAWLKHHFPLEWWTSVLGNADRKKIEEKFWPHCGHLIDNPDINKSGNSFVIDGNRILAPLDLIQGIGPAASAELNAGRPYVDLRDFCQKIANQKLKKTIEKDDDGKEVVKSGRSALHRGIVNKLICSGVMDSLFGSETIDEIGQKLEAYERITAELAKKKKWQPVNPFYTTMNPMQRYQLKKGILSAYGADLIPMAIDMKIDGFKMTPTGCEYAIDKGKIGVIRARDLEVFNEQTLLPSGGLKFIVLAYVVADVRKKFHGTKDMAELTLDIEGQRQQFVQWPDDEILPPEYRQNLKGSVVAAIIYRKNPDKPFVVSDIDIVQPPLKDIKEEE